MVLNDEDASGSISRDKQMEAASRLGGLMPEPFVTERNRFRPRDRNATSSSVKLESTYAEPQTYLERKEEYLHGSGWKDPICSLFHNGGGRQDSISTLFQTKDLATCQVEIPDAGGSFTVATPFKDSDTSSRMVDLKQVSIDYAFKEKGHRVDPKSVQGLSGCSWNCIFASIVFL